MMRCKLSAILLAYAIVLVGCASLKSGTGTPAAETPINRVESGMMDATDLPLGWSRRSTGVPRNLEGATLAWYRDYQGPPRNAMPFVRAGQETYLYPNETISATAYPSIVTEWIPSASASKYTWPSELDSPFYADEITIGCLPGVFNNISAMSCAFIVRYDELVTVVDAQVFEDRWLTMAQFRHLLERVDAKMEAIREPQTDAPSTPAP